MELEKHKELLPLLEEKAYFTIKEISQSIKYFIETNFTYLWIEGEISNLRFAQTGHIYFNLIEEEYSLKAIIFRDQKISLDFLENGLKVLVFGKLSFLTRSGEIYVIVRKVEPLGIGLIYLKKRILFKKYQYLFDKHLKRELPPYPQKIGLITSIFGAALQDFLKISQERWGIHILVYPVRVQGDGAHSEIVQAIKDLNEFFPDLDLIVISRGGGSMEDLAPFYEEELILAISNSKIPIVSAVGHEIDITLCDLAADKRCATPSAAAHEILPDRKEYLMKMDHYRKRLNQLLEIKLIEAEKALKSLQKELLDKNPLHSLYKMEHFLKEATLKLFQRIHTLIQTNTSLVFYLKRKLEENNPEKLISLKEEKLKGYKKLLFSLSPYNILERGYSIVKSVSNGAIIKSSEEVEKDELLEIILHKGRLLVRVINKD